MTLPFGVLPLLTSQSVVITGSPLEIPGQSTSAKCMNVEYYVLIINSILILRSFVGQIPGKTKGNWIMGDQAHEEASGFDGEWTGNIPMIPSFNPIPPSRSLPPRSPLDRCCPSAT